MHGIPVFVHVCIREAPRPTEGRGHPRLPVYASVRCNMPNYTITNRIPLPRLAVSPRNFISHLANSVVGTREVPLKKPHLFVHAGWSHIYNYLLRV